MRNKKNFEGFSIVEVLVAMVIVIIIIGAVIGSQINSYNATRITRDRVFAGQKTMQMMEELRAFSLTGSESTTNTLDDKDDKNFFPAILTTEKLNGASLSPITDSDINSKLPSSSTSANYIYTTSGQSHWRFLRHIKVEMLGQEQKSRKVTVQVFLSDKDGKPLYPPLAELSSILRTQGVFNEPSQVVDTYALTLGNVPGWWAALAGLRDRYQGVVSDLRNRNVGLDFKSHFINRLSYGRDTFYAPYINSTSYTKDDTHANYAYFYPGKIFNTKKSVDEFYYPFDKLKSDYSQLLTYDPGINASSEVLVNSLMSNSDNKYALADQFNNAVRYPEEVAIHTRLRKEMDDSGSKIPLEPTYRLFVEGLNSTNKYKNAIITNLHGELFPFPPLRNFSDAAKSPVKIPTVRVVSHPEQMSYNSLTNNDIKLRVYAYERPDGVSTDPGNRISNISVFIPSNGLTGRVGFTSSKYADDINELNLANFSFSSYSMTNVLNNLNIEYISPSTNNYTRYKTDSLLPISKLNIDSTPDNTGLPTTNVTGYNNAYQITQDPVFDYDGDGDTLNEDGTDEKVRGLLITLKAPTELSCPPVGTGILTLGLPSNKKLYGMDYIPTPLSTDFIGKDLDVASDKPKNTARWIIRFNTSGSVSNNPFKNFDGKLMTFETRLPTETTSSSGLITGKVDLSTGKRMDSSVNMYKGIPAQYGGTANVMKTLEELTNQIPNISRTYVWNNISTPATEKFQIIGDPRYNPYKDTLNNMEYNALYSKSITSATATTEVSSILTTDYPTLNKLMGPSYGSNGYIDDDVPRIFQLFRQGLIKSNAIYTSMTGWSNYYHGIGGEVGLDTSNGQEFNVSKVPFGGTGYESITSNTTINEIIGGIKYVRGKTQNWTSLPWLGELYPDNAFENSWSTQGNLSSDNFIRDKIDNGNFKGLSSTGVLTTSLRIAESGKTRLKRMWENGCASFFNGSSIPTNNDNFFNHVGNTAQATLSTDTGTDLSTSLNFPSPQTINTQRPFKLYFSNKPPERNDGNFKSKYESIKTELSFLPYTGKAAPYQDITDTSVFYKHDSTLAGSAAIRMHEYSKSTNDKDNPNRAYVVANGLAPDNDEAQTFMAKYAVSTMIYAFLNTGNINNVTNDYNSTPQIPYISLRQSDSKTIDLTPIPGETPKEGSLINGNTIKLEWYTRWRKWDETSYTKKYPTTWIDKTDDLSLKYQILYSSDKEVSWKYISVSGTAPSQTGTFTGTEAFPGEYNNSFSIPNQAFNTTTGISKNDGLTLDVSSLNNNQSYTIRVECYRLKGTNVLERHYAYHQRLFNIKR